MKPVIPFVALLICGLAGYGQDTPLRVVNFVGQVERDQIAVTFTLGKGSFCYGARLERTQDTTDLSSLEQVGEITGVCGNQDFEATYTLFDEQPYKNQSAFYRLILGDEPTNFLKLQFNDYGSKGFIAYPNPATSDVSIFVENPKSEPIRVEIYAPNGQLVKASAPQQVKEIQLNVDQLSHPFLIYRVYMNDAFLGFGKLMLQ